jgi:uncharacterized membrane protein YjjP (DUF1212 family)
MDSETTFQVEARELGHLLLNVGASLLSSGETCSGIRSTITRLAASYRCTPHISIGSRSVSLSLKDINSNTLFHGMLTTHEQTIDFKLISDITRLSSSLANRQLSIKELRQEFNCLKVHSGYPRLVVLIFVSIAGAAFCYTFGGNAVEMCITFGATFSGLILKQQLTKYGINPYLVTYLSAWVASLFAGAFRFAGFNLAIDTAFSTCVLFLIPGLPFINSMTDMIDGDTVNGLVKGVHAFLTALAIALGLLTTMIIYSIWE